MKSTFSIIVFAVLLTGCAPGAKKMSSNMNNASLGMTKNEVINLMGQPQSVSATHGVEYLNYKLCSIEGDFGNDFRCRGWEDYYVRLKAGRVDSYGKRGDFDSTKAPETKQTIDLNINAK